MQADATPESDGDPAAGRAHRLRLAAAVLVGVVAVLAVLYRIVPEPGAGIPAPPARDRDFSPFVSPDFPLDRGLSLVLVLAADCEHCRQTALRLAHFGLREQGVSAYLLVFGQPEEVDLFLAEIDPPIPHRRATEQQYLDLSGDDPTTVHLLENGRPRFEWAGRHFDRAVLMEELRRGR